MIVSAPRILFTFSAFSFFAESNIKERANKRAECFYSYWSLFLSLLHDRKLLPTCLATLTRNDSFDLPVTCTPIEKVALAIPAWFLAVHS